MRMEKFLKIVILIKNITVFRLCSFNLRLNCHYYMQLLHLVLSNIFFRLNFCRNNSYF